jgi:DNA-binding transcriptional ArsR family regulator
MTTQRDQNGQRNGAQVVRAIAHPLRQEILRLLNERVASPTEIAAELGLPVPNVSYHVTILARYDCIELIRTRPRRGAVEHFYRATMRPMIHDDQWTQLPLSLRRTLVGQTLAQISDHVSAAANGHGFDDAQAHVSWTRLTLDHEGWNELARLLSSTLDEAMRISADCVHRNQSTNSEQTTAEVALMLFAPR